MESIAAGDITVKDRKYLEINDETVKECALCYMPLDDLIAHTECCENCGEFCARCIIHICTKDGSGNKTVSCPFCRSVWPRVVIYHVEESHLLGAKFFSDDKEVFPIYYTSEQTLAEVQRLKGWYCPVCFFDDEGNPYGVEKLGNDKDQQKMVTIFPDFDCLQRHCMGRHKMQFCQLCIENSDLLIDESMLYTPKELREHIRRGSKGTNPHPWCSFCEKNFYDRDALQKHMLNKHLCCPFKHIHQSRTNESFDLSIFFDHPGAFESHLRDYHFLCTMPECIALVNTMGSYVVFDDPMEWKLHLSRTHGRSTSARMSLEEMHYQKPVLEFWRLKFDNNIQVIQHRRTTRNKSSWKKKMESITGSKIVESKIRAIPDKCRDEELLGKRKALDRGIHGALNSIHDLKYFQYITRLVASGKMSPEEYFHLHKRLFAFRTMKTWLDFYFDMLRIWESGAQRIALYRAYEQWSCLPSEKQIRPDGPARAPHIEGKLYESKKNSMFPSLGDKTKKKKTAIDVLKSQPKPRKARPTPAPKTGQWRTLGGTKQKRKRRRRAVKAAAPKPLSPPSNSAQKPPDSPPSTESKSTEQEEKSSPSSVPPSGVGSSPQGQASLPNPPVSCTQTPETSSTPVQSNQPWTGLGRYGQRWVNSPLSAQPSVSQTQILEKPSLSNTQSTSQEQTADSMSRLSLQQAVWSASQEQTAASILRTSVQRTVEPQQKVSSWNGIPVTFKSKKKKKKRK